MARGSYAGQSGVREVERVTRQASVVHIALQNLHVRQPRVVYERPRARQMLRVKIHTDDEAS